MEVKAFRADGLVQPTRESRQLGVSKKARQDLVPGARQAMMQQLARVQAQARILPETQPELDVIGSITAIGARHGTEPQDRAVLQELDTVLRRIERHLLQDSRRSYQNWIREQLRVGAGALHKLSTTWGQPPQLLSPEFDSTGRALVEPMAIVAAKAARWGKLWQVDQKPEWAAWWARLRERADAQERTEIAVEDVVSAMRVFRARIG